MFVVRAIILICVLAVMVLVLLSIKEVCNFESYDNAEETKKLKEEVDNEEEIISKNSVFSTLVDYKERNISNKQKFD